jgi:hypothetical protein
MSTIAAKKLHTALAKARNVGLVEETFTIEDCELVLRNLRPEQYVAAEQDCQGTEAGRAYMHAYQKAHLSRAIVSVNGVDLRDVDFVEVEEEDPKTHQPKKVKLELHQYLMTHMLNSWSLESIYTAMRKFYDVIEMAERKAKEGINFLLPEESNEEKYRRLLLEAKACEAEIPDTMIDTILEDIGLTRKASAEELRRVEEKTAQLAKDLGSEPTSPPEPESPPLPARQASEPLPEPYPEPEPEPTVRRPLNQGTRSPVVDPHATFQQAIANRRVSEPPPVVKSQEAPAVSRASQIAALEEGRVPEAYSLHPEAATEVVEIRKQAPVDVKVVAAILDKPPAAGINPKFRPGPKV